MTCNMDMVRYHFHDACSDAHLVIEHKEVDGYKQTVYTCSKCGMFLSALIEAEVVK
jgi:hypothetical protein